MKREHLSAGQARAAALRAQGFGGVRQGAGLAGLRAMIGALGALQIDSVNVLVRSHYLPAFSRLGPYDRALLERAVYGKPRRIFEYWGHEASYLPMELFPAMRWRMERSRDGSGMWKNVAAVGREKRDLVKRVRAAFEERGPLSPSEFADGKRQEKWWGWTDTRRAAEYLFWCGEITPVGRRTSFERLYDITARVIPEPWLSKKMAQHEQFSQLVAHAARSYGVATETDLRDYFRLTVQGARDAVQHLTERGELIPVNVEGWKTQAYLHRDAAVPRAARGTALLSPFDSLVWNRERTQRLFNFHYRIEIYTPAHKRVHGYYVLPYLLDGELVARVDLKADRAASTLRVHAVHYETGINKRDTTVRLREDLAGLAAWLGLERVHLSR